MQVNFGGAVCVAGTCTKDAELKYVGEKKTPMCTFSLAVGKRQDTTTIFANCKAWRSLAVQASQVHKGDSVFAVGTIEENEYNGKTYKNLVMDYFGVQPKVEYSGGEQVHSESDIRNALSDGGFTENPEAGDGDLPF